MESNFRAMIFQFLLDWLRHRRKPYYLLFFFLLYCDDLTANPNFLILKLLLYSVFILILEDLLIYFLKRFSLILKEIRNLFSIFK